MKQKEPASKTERARIFASDAGARRKSFDRLIRHVKEGYSIRCWGEYSEKTVKAFLDTYPDEWDTEELERAQCDGMRYWEGLGRAQSDGTCMGNSKSWIYNMVNRYGWTDRSEVKQEQTGGIEVRVVNYGTVPPQSSVEGTVG